jgi:hypothetical protein
MATQTFMDAMPIEFSHPLLPSTVLPENFRIHLNTGEVVTPLYVAQNPNLDFNERQTVVAFGYFANRLPTGDPGAVHPVRFEVVNGSSTPLHPWPTMAWSTTAPARSCTGCACSPPAASRPTA